VHTFPWMGSKRRLAGEILKRFPPHKTYVEAFAGSAAVLCAREEPARVEVLNDLDGEIANFFRVCKHHLAELCGQFRWALTSRAMFEWAKDTPSETLTDIQRAARFYYLQRLCFGGRPTGRTFGVSSQTKHAINLVRLEENFSALHIRLANVVIERLPWQKVVARYDHDAALFFLDPPYLATAGYGDEMWVREHYEELAAVMRGLQGKALLTINDHPEIREVFAEFESDPLRVSYTVGGTKKGAPKSNELLYRSW
jgi:DNA adenine methylase